MSAQINTVHYRRRFPNYYCIFYILSFESSQCLHLQGQAVQEDLTGKTKALTNLSKRRSMHTKRQSHIPEDLNTQQHGCENLKSRVFIVTEVCRASHHVEVAFIKCMNYLTVCIT